MEKDFDYYKDLIEKNKFPEGLPESFDQWLMKGENGETLAHVASKKGILPTDWTDDINDWLIKNEKGQTIGFLYFSHHKEHYNNPQTIENYCQNIINHLYPIVDNGAIESGYVNDLNIFLEPFIDSIQMQSKDDWMKTSDDYSGFLIDYVESIISHIQNHLYFDDFIVGYDLILANQIQDNLQQASHLINDEKMKIKEHLFSHYESKNKSIIDNKITDFSGEF